MCKYFRFYSILVLINLFFFKVINNVVVYDELSLLIINFLFCKCLWVGLFNSYFFLSMESYVFLFVILNNFSYNF